MYSKSLRNLCVSAGTALCMAASVVAMADEKDELVVPEPAMAAQRKILSVIAIVIVAGVAAYAVRWWQATHSGNVVSGGGQGDD